MKRALSLILSLCLALALLAGAALSEAAEGYCVVVTDTDGAPIPEVMVQFCSETECMFARTDARGLAWFDVAPGAYTVHVLKAPEPFEPDNTEYPAPEAPGVVAITLTRAGEAEAPAAKEAVIDAPQIGIHLDIPPSFQNLKGSLSFTGKYLSENIVLFAPIYYAVSPERFDEYSDFGEAYMNAWINDQPLPELPEPGWMSGYECGYPLVVYVVGEGQGEAELHELLKAQNDKFKDNFTSLETIGQDGDTTFFAGRYAIYEEESDNYRAAMGDFYDEFTALCGEGASFLAGLTLSAPKWHHALQVGDILSFETLDVEGNPITSREIFANARVTMVNLWGTWCGPCKKELPELAKMAGQFEAQGGQILGIVQDGRQEGKAEEARALLEEAGVEYLNVIAPENLENVFPVTGYPSTAFVDSEGRILAEIVTGALVDQYPEIMNELLK